MAMKSVGLYVFKGYILVINYTRTTFILGYNILSYNKLFSNFVGMCLWAGHHMYSEMCVILIHVNIVLVIYCNCM